MAIIENRVTEDGDVLVIKPDVPSVGLIALYNFVDTTSGESETDYFLKEFRYSINGGLTFSDWTELTIPNLEGVSISKENQFIIEYRYTRVGDTSEVELEFQDILVSGETESLPYPIYNSTYFKKFFEVNNIYVFGWALNVLEKLYQKGILPEYMERGYSTNNALEDQDFIVFWNSVTHFFAILVYFARRFRDITLYPDILESFLMSRGIDVGTAPIEDLVAIFEDYVAEVGKRGTYQVVDKKSSGDVIDGELTRLLNYSHPDELIFAHVAPHEVGWCIGRSSPVWPGTEKIINLVKGYEFTEEVEDLSKYPLFDGAYISLVNGEIVINNVPNSSFSGISYDLDEDKLIPVNKNLDYEISFMCRTTNINTPITFGADGFSSSVSPLNFLSAFSGVSLNDFFNKSTMLTDSVYFIRGIIYNQNYDKNIDTGFLPQIAPGVTNLKFDPNTDIKYIVPKIGIDNTSIASTHLAISNVKIRPLRLPFTRGQLGMKNIMMLYAANNNFYTSLQRVENKIRSTIIPANSFLKARYL